MLMNLPFSAPQLAFNWPNLMSESREDYFLTPANKDAFYLIDQWPHWPMNAVILRGCEGAGKSHLAKLWLEQSNARVLKTAADVEHAITSEHKAFLFEFENEMPLPQTALFHLLNRAFLGEIHLLITMRNDFRLDSLDLKDLRSRLRALPQAQLHAPDDGLLRAMLVKQFSDRQIEVAPDVIEFVLARIERSASGVKNAVETLDILALSEGRRLTKTNVARYLKAYQAHEDAGIQPSLNLEGLE